MLTAWGYEIDGNLPPLLEVDAFESITGGKYDCVAAEQALSAASQAVRNYCGWHVSPSVDCTAYPMPTSGVLRLPSNCVTEIESVKENGIAVTDYEWLRMGLVRRTDGKKWSKSWGAIEVDYTAGLSCDAVPDLAEAVRSIAEGVLAVSAGIASESADGVSISYSANASSVASALTDQFKAALAPYKVVGSHAA